MTPSAAKAKSLKQLAWPPSAAEAGQANSLNRSAESATPPNPSSLELS